MEPLTNLHFIIILIIINSFTINSNGEEWVHAKKIDKILENVLPCYNINGLGISVAQNDRIIYKKSFGYSDATNNIVYSTSKTKILIASVSKSFTSILVNYYSIIKRFPMQTPINSFLSENNKIVFMSPDRTKMTSFEDLLAHRMAIKRHDFVFLYDGVSSDQLLDRLKYIPVLPDKLFRVKFMYTNIMYTVVEKVIEKLLNSSFTNLLNATIFTPLNLTETTMIRKYTDKTNFAKSTIFESNLSDQILITPINALAACGIVMTITDIGKWQLFLTSHRYLKKFQLLNDAIKKTLVKKISLGKDLPKFMKSNIEATIRKKYRIKILHHQEYAMGWFISKYRNYDVFWHGGSYFGIESLLFWIPNLNISVFININAKFDHGFNNYKEIILEIPLIIVDLLLDNHTLIFSNNICNLFAIPNLIISNQTSNIFPNFYNDDRNIYSKLKGKYYHPGFGEINIRKWTENDEAWSLYRPDKNLIVLEYGNLLRAILFIHQCKMNKFYLKYNTSLKERNFQYYGFYMIKGYPYMFMNTPTVLSLAENLTFTIQCHVIFENNVQNNELKLQIRFSEDDIIEFVQKQCIGNMVPVLTIIVSIFCQGLLYWQYK